MKMQKCTALMLAFVMVLLVGCSSGSSDSKEVSIDVDKVMDEALKAAKFEEEMAELDKDVLTNIYSEVDVKDLDKFKVVTASSGAKAEELAVFKCTDKDAASRVEAAVKKRLKDIKEGFDGYLPEELSIAENAVIKKSGNVVMFAVGKNYEDIEDVFNKYIK